MESRLYSQGEVYRIFKHISPSTILFWTRKGLMESVKESTDGRGKNRFFSLENLHQLAVVEELASLNFPLDIIEDIIKASPKAMFAKMDRLLAIEKQVPGRAGMGEKEEARIFMWFYFDFLQIERYKGFFSSGVYSIVLIYLPNLAQRVEELIKAAGV